MMNALFVETPDEPSIKLQIKNNKFSEGHLKSFKA